MTSTLRRTAVITGAGSGIGRALALELAGRRCRLALSDVDEAGLADTVGACETRGAQVAFERLDVRDADAFARHAQLVADQLGPAELVFNNAGVALHAFAHEQSLDDIKRVLDVNLWGVIHGSQTFLPQLQASGGHLINISSLFGLLAVPAHSAYHASKFGVRGYTEGLAAEAAAYGHRWRVSCVHPGGVSTAIARSAHYAASHDREELAAFFANIARTTPAEAAAQILRGVERDRIRILVGADARVLHAAAQVLGSRYQRVLRFVSDRAPGAGPPALPQPPLETPATDISDSAASSHTSISA